MQTDNSYLGDKVQLRLDALPDKAGVSVLDCYHGTGLVWSTVQKYTPKIITVTGIDQKSNADTFTLRGDNRKFLPSLSLDLFDCIDLGAYGTPIENLKTVVDKKYKGVIFITFIASVFGRLPNAMLLDLGYTSAMIDKAPSLVCSNPAQKILEWLSIRGFKKAVIRSTPNGRKNYLSTSLAWQ